MDKYRTSVSLSTSFCSGMPVRLNFPTLLHVCRAVFPALLQLTAVHLIDSHLCTDPGNYVSALLLSLSTMLHLELPHINVLSKIDLIQQYGPLGRATSGLFVSNLMKILARWFQHRLVPCKALTFTRTRQQLASAVKVGFENNNC